MKQLNLFEQETWKDIEDYKGFYQISNSGRVRSLDRTVLKGNGILVPVKGKVLSLHKTNLGYVMSLLQKEGKIKNHYVHRLVAAAFIPKIEGKINVDHINGIRNDNCASNLRWCTVRENASFDNVKITKNSKYVGLTKRKVGWQAKIYHNGKTVTIGSFKTELEGAEAYQNYVQKNILNQTAKQ